MTVKLMRHVVTRAARLNGLGAAGAEPQGTDATDYLQHAQSVIDTLPGYRNGPWYDKLLTSSAAYTAKDGYRISPQGFDPVITLPTTFTRCDSDTDIQNDLSRVHVIGGGFYIWSSSKGAWTKADNLTLNDPFPFGDEDLPGIAALTAISAAPEYGAEVSAATQQRGAITLASVRSRFYRNRDRLCWLPCFRDYV